MRSTVIIQFLFAIMTVHASAQVPQTRDFMKQIGDSFNELEGNLTLYFFNALNGEPIQNGVVQMLDIGQFETDEEGKILFPIPDDGSRRRSYSFQGCYSPFRSIFLEKTQDCGKENDNKDDNGISCLA